MLAHQPRTLRIAALLDKPSRRKQPIEAHYIGFAIPDAYVVGYGLDYAERYPKLIDGVSRADVQEVAQKYLHPDALDLVAVANQAAAKITPAALSVPTAAAK